MNYELAKQLKDAGFNQLKAFEAYYLNAGAVSGIVDNQMYDKDSILRENKVVAIPTLSELIEACGSEFGYLHNRIHKGLGWAACANGTEEHYGETPEVAVAKLWLYLNDNKTP